MLYLRGLDYKSMEISWLGHSCFRIRGSQVTVITDPYSPDMGYSLGKPKARIVTVSHQHPGHSYVQGVGGEPRLITGPGEYEIGGVLIIGLATFHDAENGSQRGKNTVYLMEIDEISLCHLGDLGHMLTAEQMEELDNVDILLVPVGGVSTIGAPVAAELARQLEPEVVIPMHYRTVAHWWGSHGARLLLRPPGRKPVVVTKMPLRSRSGGGGFFRLSFDYR
jgi:L-ascorbate metabolism protein UlaG (beta-lactamase superfamily)